MELMTCIETRRSVRAFNEKPVADETLVSLVEAAKYAPSWKNTQVTRYYAVKDPVKRAALVAAMPDFNQPATSSAPVVIVSTVVKARSGYNRQGEFDTAKGKGWQMYDCGASNMLFALKANELGLGTVVMGYYDEEAVAKVIDLPETEEIVSVLALGYYDEMPEMPKRKGADMILKTI